MPERNPTDLLERRAYPEPLTTAVAFDAGEVTGAPDG
jgi:hypothetical protein